VQHILSILPDEHIKVPFSRVAQYFATGAIFENDLISTDHLPIKGEVVLATFDEDEEEGKLLCTRIELLPRVELPYLNLNELSKFRKLLSTLMDKK
jgi:hypothetical protein